MNWPLRISQGLFKAGQLLRIVRDRPTICHGSMLSNGYSVVKGEATLTYALVSAPRILIGITLQFMPFMFASPRVLVVGVLYGHGRNDSSLLP
jgi:hypothetical protein